MDDRPMTQEIWNFAYGGNMNPKVLTDRRKIDPLESVAGVLEDYRLVFNTRGIPVIEPVFANVEPAKGECVHGMLHRLTEEQFARLDLFEGNGIAYRLKELEVKAYDGRKILARVYSAIMVTPEKSPSCRYLNIIKEGARSSRLDPGYVQKLEGHPCRRTLNLPDKVFVFFEKFLNAGKPVLFIIKTAERLQQALTRMSGKG